MIYVCPEKDCRVSEPCKPCICGMDKLKEFGGTDNPTPRVDPPAPMTAHDKALEAALDGFYTPDPNDSGLEPHARELCDMQRAITAYHAALEGQGESAIAEIRKRHDEDGQNRLPVASLDTFAALFEHAHADRATLLTRLAELERERDTLQSSVAEMQKFLGGRFDEAAEAERLRTVLAHIAKGGPYRSLEYVEQYARAAVEQSNG